MRPLTPPSPLCRQALQESFDLQLRTTLGYNFPLSAFEALDPDKAPRLRGAVTKAEFCTEAKLRMQRTGLRGPHVEDEAFDEARVRAQFDALLAAGSKPSAKLLNYSECYQRLRSGLPELPEKLMQQRQPPPQQQQQPLPAETSADAGGHGFMASARRKLARQQTEMLNEEQVAEAMQRRQEERLRDEKRREQNEQARRERLKLYETSLHDLWSTQWVHVQLGRLPSDQLVDGMGVVEREPLLMTQLAELMRNHFQQLFDTYLYYAKVEIAENATELYRMTESSWKTLLRVAGVVGTGAQQVSTTTCSRIFTQVNQRRDNLMKGAGSYATAVAEGTNNAAVTAGVLQATDDFDENMLAFDAVTRSHYAAGSLFSFTFSEFLEGVVFVALELQREKTSFVALELQRAPSAADATSSEPSDETEQSHAEPTRTPLRADDVLLAVQALLVDRILKNAKVAPCHLENSAARWLRSVLSVWCARSRPSCLRDTPCCLRPARAGPTL